MIEKSLAQEGHRDEIMTESW